MRAYATANSPQAEVLEVNQSPENGVKVLIDTQLNKQKTASEDYIWALKKTTTNHAYLVITS